MKAKALRRTLAVAALLAVIVVFLLEGLQHRHAGTAEGRNCPACQSARLGVGDAPSHGAILPAPAPARPLDPDPGIERVAGPAPISSSAPRSPPVLSA